MLLILKRLLILLMLAAPFGCSEHYVETEIKSSIGSDSCKNGSSLSAVDFYTSLLPTKTSADDSCFSDFAVFANYILSERKLEETPCNFFFNKVVVKGIDGWDYTPKSYWPNSGSLSFFAYSPSSEYKNGNLTLTSDATTAGAPMFSYTLSSNVLNHVDLLFSDPLLGMTKSNVDENGKLNMRFNHFLSAVQIGAKIEDSLDYAGYEIVINRVEFKNLKSGGDIIFNANDGVNGDGSGSGSGSVNGSAGGNKYCWSNVNDYPTGSYILTTDSLLRVAKLTDSNFANICNRDIALMIVPQEVGDDCAVEVEMLYCVNVGSNSGLGGGLQMSSESASGSRCAEIVRRAIPLKSLIPVFEAGKRYSLNIVVSCTSEVSVTCTVVPWNTETCDVPAFKS